jgi:hypothetical protein
MKAHGLVRVACLWEMKNANKIVTGKSERKNHLGINKWKDIIKMGLKGIRCEGLDCGSDSYGSGQNSVADSCEHENHISDLREDGKFLIHLSDY